MKEDDQKQDINIAVMSLRMKHIEETISDIKNMITDMKKEMRSEHKEIWSDVERLKMFKVKVTAYATLGSMAGGGLVTLISKLIG